MTGLEEIVPEYLLGVRATLDEGLEDEIEDPLEGATLEDLVQDAEKLKDRQKIDAEERDLGER